MRSARHFFASKRIAAIARADAPDRVILRIVADESPLHIEIGFGMKAAGKIVGVAEVIERDFAHARHQAHVEHDIHAIGDLNADFAESANPPAP